MKIVLKFSWNFRDFFSFFGVEFYSLLPEETKYPGPTGLQPKRGNGAVATHARARTASLTHTSPCKLELILIQILPGLWTSTTSIASVIICAVLTQRALLTFMEIFLLLICVKWIYDHDTTTLRESTMILNSLYCNATWLRHNARFEQVFNLLVYLVSSSSFSLNI